MLLIFGGPGVVVLNEQKSRINVLFNSISCNKNCLAFPSCFPMKSQLLLLVLLGTLPTLSSVDTLGLVRSGKFDR